MGFIYTVQDYDGCVLEVVDHDPSYPKPNLLDLQLVASNPDTDEEVGVDVPLIELIELGKLAAERLAGLNAKPWTGRVYIYDGEDSLETAVWTWTVLTEPDRNGQVAVRRDIVAESGFDVILAETESDFYNKREVSA